MSTNRYDVLAKPPELELKKLPKKLQSLAKELMASGRLRIDVGDARNFIRWRITDSEPEIVLSVRELTDKQLQKTTQNMLLATLSRYDKATAESLVKNAWAVMQRDAGRLGVPEHAETAIACALVQAAEPDLIKLALLQRVEIFVSFGFQVGDVMNVWDWQQHGKNSGMQNTGKNVFGVYVSCGGNPLAEEDEKTYKSDGFPALARLMIVAAQELGHFADLKRNDAGRPVGRFSAQHSPLRPSAACKKARDTDIARHEAISKRLHALGIERLAWREKHMKSVHKESKPGLFPRFIYFLHKQWVMMRCRTSGLGWVCSMSHKNGWATQAMHMLPDMKFNLSPKADVYKRNNPDEEEAIACIEALARVPQQRLKWGDGAARACMHHLYALYYDAVIPAVGRSVHTLQHKKSA
jgi:hypothetical protein